MKLKDIKDFQVGEAVTFSNAISQRDVDRFVELTGDDNPMHIDAEFSAQTQIHTPVAHGMLTASFISTVIGKHLPGPGALWVSQKLEFLLPVRVGDSIKIRAEIKKINQPGRLLTIDIRVVNHRNQDVLRGEAVVRWPQEAISHHATDDHDKPMKVALVTGASRGIGAEIALSLGRQGYFVYINYFRSVSRAEEILRRIKLEGGEGQVLQANAFDSASLEQLFSSISLRHNRLDLLVNNASPEIYEADFFEFDWNQFEAQFLPHIRSMFKCIKLAVPLFDNNGGGSIVNIGSIVVDYDPPTKWLGYNLGKGCIHLMTKNLATCLGAKNIRINTVAPGMTETDMIVDMPERQLMMLKMKTPMKKLAQPSDIAAMVSFLGSDAARHVSGQIVSVNGGIC